MSYEKKTMLMTLVIVMLAFSLTTSAFAQDYYFSLDALTVDVYWNRTAPRRWIIT